MGTLKTMLTAVGVVIVLFGGVWLLIPGLSARERRGVAVGALVVGALLLVAGLL